MKQLRSFTHELYALYNNFNKYYKNIRAHTVALFTETSGAAAPHVTRILEITEYVPNTRLVISKKFTTNEVPTKKWIVL